MTSRESELRVLVLGHAFVVPSNRARWRRFAQLYPSAEVVVAAPAEYRTTRYGVEQIFRPEEEHADNYHVVPLRTGPRGLYRSLHHCLRQWTPNIVQVNEEPSEWVLLQALIWSRAVAPRAARLFYFWTNVLAPPRQPWNRAKHRMVFGLADAAMVGGDDSANVLRSLGFLRPIALQTELGVDEGVWWPRTDRSDGPFTVGFVGPLLPEKGVADLARALCRLDGQWQLVVCGDGPEREVLRQILGHAGVANRLRFEGVVPRDKLPEKIRRLDVLVLPSRSTLTAREQFGLVLAEAMLSGVPVVGSDVGGIPTTIGEGGLVFAEGDCRELAAHLQLLMDQPGLRRQLAARGRQRAVERYSASALAEQTHAVYRDLCADPVGANR